MTMITRPVGSLCVHRALTCQSVRVHGPTLAHSLLAEHVRIMQETFVKVFVCKARAIWKEVGLCLCWKWVLCLVVFGRCFGGCVVVTVQKKKNDFCNYRKISRG